MRIVDSRIHGNDIKYFKDIMKKRIIKTIIFIIGILGVIVVINWDLISYLIHIGIGQANLIFNSKPINKLLKDPTVLPDLKKKFLLVSEIKEFAEKEIGLKSTSNYTKYFHTDKSCIVYVISASPADKLETYIWHFPIMGGFPYKGFFDVKKALDEKIKLESNGYDTHLREVTTYSTLGWLPDPLLSTMLKYDDYELANLIIHESTHATIFIKNKVTFNENLALFVGHEGALQFIRKKYGNNSIYEQQAINVTHDSKIFSDYINYLCTKLEKIYSQNISSSEKIRQKIKLFKEEKQKYKNEWGLKFKSDIYKGIVNVDWNNAHLLAYRTYYQDLSQFYKTFKEHGSNLKATVEYFKLVSSE